MLYCFISHLAGIEANAPEDVVDKIRKASSPAENSRDHWMWVIGDRRFVQAALEHDHLKRLTALERMNSGWTLEDIAGYIADKMKLDRSQIRHRGRENSRSNFRKIFAALTVKIFGKTLNL